MQDVETLGLLGALVLVLLKTMLDRKSNGTCAINPKEFQTLAARVHELTRMHNDPDSKFSTVQVLKDLDMIAKDLSKHRLDGSKEHNVILLAVKEGKQ